MAHIGTSRLARRAQSQASALGRGATGQQRLEPHRQGDESGARGPSLYSGNRQESMGGRSSNERHLGNSGFAGSDW